jgi:hypothetical protein
MTTWTDISNPAVAVGGIPSSTTVTALRDNPVALAEAASGAPVMVSGWHPYNKVTVGDSNTGVIYDSSIDGTVAEIVTPDFEDGYEYRIIATDLSHNSGSNRTLLLQHYYQSEASYRTAYTTTADSASNPFDMDAEIILPRLSRPGHFVRVQAATDGVASAAANGFSDPSGGGSDRVLKVKLIFSAGSIDGGKVYMLRRREYLSSP